MIQEVSSVAHSNFITVNAITSVKKMISYSEQGIKYFVVTEEGKFLGVITLENLLESHPNRIAVDVHMNDFEIAAPCLSIWEAYEKLENNKHKILIIKNNPDKITGIVDFNSLLVTVSKYTDPLTGLYKGDYLYFQGLRTLDNEEEISIFFLDINEFGLINKKYGHINGNIILSELSSILKKTTPDYKWCRFGGDEFALIAPLQLEESINLAEKIINNVNEYNFSLNIPINVSIGIAGAKKSPRKKTSSPYMKGDYIKIINTLLNKASLESTKAKKFIPHCFSVGGCLEISEIA